MSSFIVDLWESIFVPGPTPAILRAANATFAALQATLLALLVGTHSIHFAVLSVLSAGLWWSINWFARELAAAAKTTTVDDDSNKDKNSSKNDISVWRRRRLRRRKDKLEHDSPDDLNDDDQTRPRTTRKSRAMARASPTLAMGHGSDNDAQVEVKRDKNKRGRTKGKKHAQNSSDAAQGREKGSRRQVVSSTADAEPVTPDRKGELRQRVVSLSTLSDSPGFLSQSSASTEDEGWEKVLKSEKKKIKQEE